MVTMHRAMFAELDTMTLHDLMKLRIDVFVVEQECAYPELDGRDTEPQTEHVWYATDEGMPVAYLRVLREADGGHRIGRVVTAPSHRGQGLARQLMTEILVDIEGTVVLDAQTYLRDWYISLGYQQAGDEFVEDGIPHIPMTLAR